MGDRVSGGSGNVEVLQLEKRQIFGRVPWRLLFSDLEMKFGARHEARHAALGNDIARLDDITAIDEKLAVVGIDCHPAALMLEEDQIAEGPEAVAGVDHRSGEARPDFRSLWHQNIDAFGAGGTSFAIVIIDDLAVHGPGEMG